MADIGSDRIRATLGWSTGLLPHKMLVRLYRLLFFGVRSEKQLKDFVQGTIALFWQRQFMYISAGLLAGYYYEPRTALTSVALCEITELVDVFISRRLLQRDRISRRKMQEFYFLLLASSILSAMAVAYFAASIARMEGASIHFAPMFFLFAAGLFAAVNNHQLPLVLYVRLVIYGAVFLSIPIRDLLEVRPSFDSELWMQFLTIIFVLYFVVDCSRIFLKLYQKNLDQLDDLRSERDRAQAAYEVKSQFVSTVSHELRTPLTSVLGTLEMLQSGAFDRDEERRKKLVTLAHKNGKRLSSLINDILDVQKLESGQMRFDLQPTRYADCLTDAVDAVSGMADTRNVKINLGQLDHTLTVNADHNRIVQVITNVLSNAVKFSNGAGQVDVDLSTVGTTARLIIRDYGIGIPENAQNTVFGRFLQVDSSDHRQFEGTGLGMSISHDIMQAHGGKMHYESEIGKGTSFFIELPMFEETNPDGYDGVFDNAPEKQAKA